MAIQCDYDASEKDVDVVADPFMTKVEEATLRRKRIYEIFRSLNANAFCEIKDTALIQLIFIHNTEFSDEDMMTILKLNPREAQHRQLYSSLLNLIQHTAMILKGKVIAKRLEEMPLTDIRRICYRIADRFDSLFYVPVNTKTEDDSNSNIALSFAWKDRYNSQWPIASMLSREYRKISQM